MNETMNRLEDAFDEALHAYLEAKGSEDEDEAYERFLKAYDALREFDSGEGSALPSD